MSTTEDTAGAVREYLAGRGFDPAVPLRQSVMGAMDSNPETEAELRRVAKRTGVSLLAARIAPDEVKRQARVQDMGLDGMAGQFPSTARWLLDQDNARLAHDDTDVLKSIEAAARYVTTGRGGLGGDLVASAYNTSSNFAGVGRAALEFLAMRPEGMPRNRLLGAGIDYLAGTARDATANAKQWGSQGRGIVSGGVSSGVQSFAQNMLMLPMALLPGGQGAAMAGMVSSTGGQAYQQGREKGLPVGQALPFAASQAAIEYATERLPLARLIGDVKAGTPIFQTLVRQVALEVPGEQVATVLQDLNEWAVLNPAKPFSDYLAERPSAAAQTLIATLVGVGGNVAVTSGLQSIADRAAGRDRQAENADRQMQALAELATLAEASKLRQRDPEAFATFAQELADQQVPRVFLDAQVLQQSGVDLQALAQAMPSVAQQVSEAIATGGDIAIPTGEFLAAGQQFAQPLLEHARTAPDAMSAAEARVYMQDRGDALQAEITRTMEAAMTTDAQRAEVDQIRGDFARQLQQAGRTQDVAQAEAGMVAAFYATQAQRLGITAAEMAQRYPLQVRGTLGEGGRVLAQNSGMPSAADQPAQSSKFSEDNRLSNLSQAGPSWQRIRENNPALAGVRSMDDEVTIYRATVGDSIRPDDYVAVSKATLKTELANVKARDKSAKIISMKVRVRDLLMGNDATEFVYFPSAPAVLNQSARDQTDTPEFRAWFGDSKVVDSDGKPLVLYHGTTEEVDTLAAPYGGLYLAEDPNVSTGYAFDSSGTENYVHRVAVKATRVFDATSPGAEQVLARIEEEYDNATDYRDPDDGEYLPLSAWVRSGQLHKLGRKAQNEVMESLRAEGYDAVRYLDASPMTGDSISVVVFDPGSVRILENDPSAQAFGSILDQQARGQIALGEDITQQASVITLLTGADLSTFTHELGHFFLEVQADIAARIEAQVQAGAGVSDSEQQALADMRALLRWFGIQDTPEASALTQWLGMGIDERRDMHERFARGFEAYAFEGQAPSLELQGTFQRFRSWLVQVYRQLLNLNVELTDEVRQVMGRMVATDEQIRTAEAARGMGPLFETAEQAGMTPEQWAAYHGMAAEATAQAMEALQVRGLRDMQWLQGAKARQLKRLQRLHNELRREVEREVRAEVMSQPVYRAWQFLTTKADRDQTATQEPRKASKGLDVTRDSLLVAIAKLGGISRESALRDLGVSVDDLRADVGVFGAPLWRKTGGMTAGDMREELQAHGYMTGLDEFGRTELRELEDRIREELGGAPQYSMAHDYAGDQVQAVPGDAIAGKLRTSDVRALAVQDGQEAEGRLTTAEVELLTSRRMLQESGGLPPDAVADVFGFDSGDALVQALARATPPRDAIRALTDQRMLERHGDLATPEGLERAADAAIHTEARARFIATELTALERASQVRQDAGTAANGRRRTVDALVTAAREYAQQLVARTKAGDLRPAQYTAAEARAAKRAADAVRKGDTAEAAEAKRVQVIQHAAAREALAAQDEAAKAVRYFRRFDRKPKGMAADYFDQIEALLERHDLRQGVTVADRAKRQSLLAWVESQRERGLEPDIPPELLDEARRVHFRDLTVEEVRGLRDTIRQIEQMGRLKGKLMAAQELREYEAVRDEIADSIVDNSRGRTADTRTPATVLGRSLASIRRFGAAHIKAATWARIMDGGEAGPLWQYIIRPANAAADMETTMRAKATEELTAIMAPLLRGDGLTVKRTFPSIGRSLTREQVLAIALNTGNDGNMQRLLGGEGWSVQQLQPVLATVTAAEWRAVQAVWDHLESYRPMIAAKERRLYGKEPNWVTPAPREVTTADGDTIVLRGGYYPIKYDPMASVRAEEHSDAEEAARQLRGAYTSATTRRSFTKERAAAVEGRPLLYSLAGVYSGVQDVIHDLAWHEWLIDTQRLLRSENIDRAIRETYGPDVVRQFKTWAQDIAAGEGKLQAELDTALGKLRQSVSVAGLGFNVMSAVVQPLGLTQSIVRVGAPWIGAGIRQYVANPIAATKRANQASEFMASRARTRFRELAELRNQIEGQNPAREWIARNAFWLMLRAQMLVDVPTWLGAYERAMSEGNTEERARALADQAVIDSQGGGQTKDLSGIERGGPAQKLFTVFYSFMNTALNLGVAQGMTAEKSARGRAKLAADMLLLYTIPAVLGTLLKDALTPGDSGDDEPEELAKKLAAAQLDYLMGMMVLVREMTAAGKMALGLEDKPRDWAGPAGLRLIPDTAAFVKQASQGEFDDAFRKATVNLVGDLFGLPAAQANRTITGTKALIDGETENPAAIVFGFQKEN
jgi:hypothetical protein